MELTAPTEPGPSPAFIAPEPAPEPKPAPEIDGWPLSGAEARRLQAETAPGEASLRIELGDGIALDLVWVPPGSFVMGSREESPEERPMAPVRIEEGFWMSRTEISNALYARFDPAHNSRYFNMGGTNQLRNGFGPDVRPMNEDDQPVVRVSWQEARAFCRRLGEQTDMDVDLPTEAQWEWACRAGSARSAPLSGQDAAQAPSANCAGVSYGEFHYDRAFSHRVFDPDWDDGVIATEEVGSYAANAWGLHDMLGNAAEWTRSLHRPYPYRPGDGRNDSGAEGRRVVRGGAFSDRPKRCTPSYRLGYHPWQGVYNVGFRVIIRPEKQ